MNKTRKLLTILVSIALLLVLIAWLAGAFRSKIEPATLDQTVAPTPEQLYTVAALQVSKLERVAATVSSKQATYISARILAPIEKIRVRAGDNVTAGQLLVELDQRQLIAKRQQAQQAMAAINAQLTDARQDYQRMAKLYQDKVVSKADLDKASNRQASLSAELQGAKRALEEAETAVSYSRITAPIDGKVVDRFMEPGDTAAPGQHILSLYNPGNMRVEAHVREGLALQLTMGQLLEARIPAVNKTVPVALEEIVPAADPGARTFLVKAALPGELGVYPGMYAELIIPAGDHRVLHIPQQAVTTVGQQQYVLLWDGKHIQRRYVRLGRATDDGLVAVASGLSAGQQLVLPAAD